jgi:ABC-type transporter Mla MlaB component
MAERALRLSRGEDGRLRVEGELTRHTVMRALREFDDLARDLPRWIVDCGACGPVDSAAVAWLIELRKRARREQRSLRFESLPSSIHSIARMSQVEGLLAPDD